MSQMLYDIFHLLAVGGWYKWYMGGLVIFIRIMPLPGTILLSLSRHPPNTLKKGRWVVCGSILQACTCQIFSFAEIPRWSQVWQVRCILNVSYLLPMVCISLKKMSCWWVGDGWFLVDNNALLRLHLASTLSPICQNLSRLGADNCPTLKPFSQVLTFTLFDIFVLMQ